MEKARDLWIRDGIVKEYRGKGEEVVVPEGVTDIGDKAFSGCRNLKKVVLPESLKSIGFGAFAECRDLTEIRIPEGTAFIRDWAFYCCMDLREVTVPGSVFRIQDHVFEGCWSLVHAEIREGVRSIGFRSFMGCEKLEEIRLPGGLTSIGVGAFSDCGSLQLLYLPESVRLISDLKLPVPHVVCHTKSQASHAEIPVYLGGPVTDLPVKERPKAAEGYFYGLEKGFREVDSWRKSYLPYVRKIMKEYISGDREDRDFLWMLIREGFPTRRETDLLTERCTELGDVETAALLLQYKNDRFGKKGLWDLNL